MMGRPSSYTPAIADEICERIADGEPLRRICRDEHMPSWRTVYNWREANTDFSAAITRARDIGFDAIAEEALEISDTPVEAEEVVEGGKYGMTVKRSDALGHRRLQVETRLKLLAKWSPRKYGDLLQQEITNPDGSLTGSASEATIAAKLAAIQQAALARKKAQEDGVDDGDCTDLV